VIHREGAKFAKKDEKGKKNILSQYIKVL